MALVICNGGKTKLLQQLLTYLNGLTLRLFQNNINLAITDTAGTYTEATFTGYSAIALGAWGTAFLNASSLAETDEVVRTFSQTGTAVTNTIYGYYITDSGGNLIYAEKNPNGSFAMNTAGLTYSVQPILTLANANGT